MNKANHFTVVLATGKEVEFEFGRQMTASSYEGTLTAEESQELEAIQLRLS